MTDIAGVTLLHTLDGHEGSVGQIAWSPDGRRLATSSSDATVRIWDVDKARELHRITHRVGSVRAIAFDRDGELLASAAGDDTIRLWRVGTWKLLQTHGFLGCRGLAFGPGSRLVAGGETGVRAWEASRGDVVLHLPAMGRYLVGVAVDRGGDTIAAATSEGIAGIYDGRAVQNLSGDLGTATDVALEPGGDALAVSYHGGAIGVFGAGRGELRSILEGHTSPPTSVDFSHDGRFLASKSDDEVRLWDSESGLCLGALPVSPSSEWPARVAWGPDALRLAAPSGPSIRIFEIDSSALLGAAYRDTVRYVSAKIVLVGESGVGKTGLGWRLAHGEFKEQASTHGQQFWPLESLGHTRTDGAECEAVLWDLAGQPDYRLVHALFLDDADLGLLLFDPTKDDLRVVDYWRSHFGEPTETILVAARADRGTSPLSLEEIRAYCAARSIREYYVTSAMSGEGLDGLVAGVAAAIPWESKPATVTTETFKRLKDDVLALREDPAQKVIVSPRELRAALEHDRDLGRFSDEEMLTAVGHLSNHGYVAQLTTSRAETRILLKPELLNNVAASIVLEARRDERELGSLLEAGVLSNTYGFPELNGLADEDRAVLLDSAVTMFLAHNVCFRETDPLSSRTYLVFPELINLKKPVIENESPTADGPSYTVNGAVQNVYASLVVLLGYTNTFTRASVWQKHARYFFADGRVCGFRMETDRDDALDFILYFGTNLRDHERQMFQAMFESFLARQELTVLRYEPVSCPEHHRLNRAVVREELAAGNEAVFCNRCGKRVPLSGALAPLQLTVQAVDASASEQRTADVRSRFERVLFRLSAHVKQEGILAPECFISYAWGVPAQEQWVEQRLATDLKQSGVRVILDRWENRIGSSIPRFVDRVADADCVIVVGTELYLRKYQNREETRGFVVAAEGDLISNILIGSEIEKARVFPLLLDGEPRTSLPALVRPKVFADFRRPDGYFTEMLRLLLSLYDIGPGDPVGIELRSLLEGPDAHP